MKPSRKPKPRWVADNKAAQMTFGKGAEEWITEQCKRKNKPWRSTTAEKVRYVLLGRRLESWRDRPVSKIEGEEISAIVESLGANSQQTFLAPIRGFFKWATRKGYVKKSPVVGIVAPSPEGNANPLIVFEEEGEPDFSEMKAFLECLNELQEQMPLSPWPTIYRLGLLTGARYTEVVGLPRKELKLDAALWTLPVERSKVKLECDRPLSAATVKVLRGIEGEGELVFPGKIQGHALTKSGTAPDRLAEKLLARGFKNGFWYGRLRDTVASWLEFQPDATERAMAVILNHQPPRDNTRRKNYVQISGRKQARVLLERWAAQVQRVMDGTAATVTPIRKSA